MGAAASVQEWKENNDITNISWCTKECTEFIEIFMALTIKDSKASSALRHDAWKSLDNNGNGYVSLAETGKWIQTLCILKYLAEESNKTKATVEAAKQNGVALYKMFYASYIRAFLDAADIGKDKRVAGTKTATTDDYVTWGEFRCLCAYLCIYALMFDAFAKIDGGSAGTTKDDDRRISKAEYEKCLSEGNPFKGHALIGLCVMGTSKTEVDAAFQAMDADGKGMVLLKEWCDYLENCETAAGTKLSEILDKGEEKTDGAKEAATAATSS